MGCGEFSQVTRIGKDLSGHSSGFPSSVRLFSGRGPFRPPVTYLNSHLLKYPSPLRKDTIYIILNLLRRRTKAAADHSSYSMTRSTTSQRPASEIAGRFASAKYRGTRTMASFYGSYGWRACRVRIDQTGRNCWCGVARKIPCLENYPRRPRSIAARACEGFLLVWEP